MSFEFGTSRRGRGSGKGGGKNAGFYIAVGLCCAAVCLVGISAAMGSRRDVTRTAEDYVVALDDGEWSAASGEEQSVDASADGTTAQTAQPTQPSDISVTEPTEYLEPADAGAMGDGWVEELPMPQDGDEAVDVSAEPMVMAISYSAPLSGGLLKPYSGGELVYCSTMGDWRVHEGMDISGEKGAEVRAAADGIVVDFVEDMLYGHTAVIQHDDGSMLYYCGLSSTPVVSSGLAVKAGDVIGFIGEVPCESGDGAHLHLAMMKDGAFVDPGQYIKLG